MPIAIKLFLSKYWQLIALAILIVLLFFACRVILDQKYQQGYSACTVDVAEAKKRADEATRQAQAEIQLKSQEEENEVRKLEGADAPASDYLRTVLKRLRVNN